jgi:hypothetical protein
VLVTIEGPEPLSSLAVHAALDSPPRSSDVTLPARVPTSLDVLVPNVAATLTVTVHATDLSGATQMLAESVPTVVGTQQHLSFSLTLGGGSDGGPSDQGQSKGISPSLVQVMRSPSSVSASQTVTINETSADLLVAAIYWSNAAAVITVDDSLHNVWSTTPPQINDACTNHSSEVQLFYAENVVGGTNMVTAHQSASTSHIGFYLLQLHGLATSSALDTSVGTIAPAAGSHVVDGGRLVTTGALDAVVALFFDSQGSGVMTPGAGLTRESTDSNAYSMVADVPGGVPAGSYSITATLPVDVAGPRSDNCWAATAAAFRTP